QRHAGQWPVEVVAGADMQVLLSTGFTNFVEAQKAAPAEINLTAHIVVQRIDGAADTVADRGGFHHLHAAIRPGIGVVVFGAVRVTGIKGLSRVLFGGKGAVFEGQLLAEPVAYTD